MEWQPIETAPKNWTSVIVYDRASTDVCEAYFRDEADPDDSCWCRANTTPMDEDSIIAEPRFWMPLPAPPAEGRG